MPEGVRSLRAARAEDGDLLWRWANDPVVRSNSFESEPIPIDRHRSWFADRLADPGTRIWMLEHGPAPAGQVRYQRSGDVAFVSISVADGHRGHGHARELLAMTAEDACASLGVTRLVAIVLAQNAVSRRLFADSGYREVGAERRAGKGAVRFERACPITAGRTAAPS